MRGASHNERLNLSLVPRGARAQIARPPAETSQRGASALAYVAMDASRRARASLADPT